MGKVTRTHSLVLRTSHMPHSPVWSGRRESNSRHQLGRLRPMPLDHARSKICAAVILYRRGAGGSAGVPPATDETLCRSHHLPPAARRTSVAEAGVEPARAGL